VAARGGIWGDGGVGVLYTRVWLGWAGRIKWAVHNKWADRGLPREPYSWHSGKRLFPECQTNGTRGTIFCLFVFFCLIFFEVIPHYFKLLDQIWGYFEFVLYISLVFFILLNFLAFFKFELQVHEVMKFLNSKNDIHYIWCMFRPYLGSHMKFRTSFCRNMTDN
jgi:hypothetical protein